MWWHMRRNQILSFRRTGRVHLNRWWRQFSRLLAAEVHTSVVVMVVMLDTPCSEVMWRVPATHSIRHFPLLFPSRASPCAVTFQLESTRLLSSIFRMTKKMCLLSSNVIAVGVKMNFLHGHTLILCIWYTVDS